MIIIYIILLLNQTYTQTKWNLKAAVVLFTKWIIVTLVFILDGSSEHDAHVWTETGNLICSRHLATSTTLSNLLIVFLKKVFLHTCAACSELPPEISTKVQWFYSWTAQQLFQEFTLSVCMFSSPCLRIWQRVGTVPSAGLCLQNKSFSWIQK